MKVVNLEAAGLLEGGALFELFERLRDEVHWTEYPTRTTRRLVDSIVFSGISQLEPERRPREDLVGPLEWRGEASSPFELPASSAHLAFLEPLFEVLQHVATQHSRTASDDHVIPLQCFLCLYPAGSDACPAHAHHCRQLTLSLGAPRWFFCWEEDADDVLHKRHQGARRTVRAHEPPRRRVLLRHGDALLIDGARHAVPPLGVYQRRL